jgi:uncharacterized protein (DUF2336 family)
VNIVQNLLTDLERSIALANRERREATLHDVMELFLTDVDVLTDEQIELFDHVLVRLARAIEIGARADLAVRLAAVPRAPAIVVRMLAHDEIKVARPILATSPRLSDPDLIGVALTRGPDHMRAIAERRGLSVPVTDILVSRGDLPVLQTLAANDAAHLSRQGVAALVDQALEDEGLRRILEARSDLPEAQLHRLFDLARSTARRHLAEGVPADLHELLEQALDRSTRRVRAIVAGNLDYAEALETIGTIELSRAIDEEDVRGFAASGQVEETICAIAAAAGLRLDTAERLFTIAESQLLLVVGKALGWSFTTLEALLALRDPDSVRRHLKKRVRDRYEDLPAGTAETVLRFMRQDARIAARA